MNSRVMHTARTEIIENGARASRILHFRLGGGTRVRKIIQPLAETADLNRRGNSNVLAFSIISVFTVSIVHSSHCHPGAKLHMNLHLLRKLILAPKSHFS